MRHPQVNMAFITPELESWSCSVSCCSVSVCIISEDDVYPADVVVLDGVFHLLV